MEGYNTILQWYDVPVSPVKSIIMKSKMFKLFQFSVVIVESVQIVLLTCLTICRDVEKNHETQLNP